MLVISSGPSILRTVAGEEKSAVLLMEISPTLLFSMTIRILLESINMIVPQVAPVSSNAHKTKMIMTVVAVRLLLAALIDLFLMISSCLGFVNSLPIVLILYARIRSAPAAGDYLSALACYSAYIIIIL